MRLSAKKTIDLLVEPVNESNPDPLKHKESGRKFNYITL